MNWDIIKIHNDKNIKFFHSDLVNVALEAARNIEKIEKYDKVLEMTVLYSKGCFLLVTLPNSYLIIYVY